MRSEEEIREMIETYKQIRDKAFFISGEFEMAVSSIHALEWVLEDTDER